MQARLSFASILLLTASSAWLALAQQSCQTGAFMSDRDKAGLRGPVRTVLEEQPFSGADGQQLEMVGLFYWNLAGIAESPDVRQSRAGQLDSIAAVVRFMQLV